MVKIEECWDCEKMRPIYDSGRCHDCYEVWIETEEEVTA